MTRSWKNVLTNRPNRLKAIVEDESDVAFWHAILKKIWPGRPIVVTQYSHGTTAEKGKAGILKMAPNFGPLLIGSVDSDNDWTLDQYTRDGILISQSPYILQTYAYGVENLLLQPYDIDTDMLKATAHDCDLTANLHQQYRDILECLSISVYLPLIWHLAMVSTHTNMSKPAEGWEHIIGSQHYTPLISTAAYDSWDLILMNVKAELKRRSDELVARYRQEHPELEPRVNALKTELEREKQLTPETAYLYVDAHRIFDFMQDVYLKKIEGLVISHHNAEIKSRTTGSESQAQLNHYRNVRTSFEKVRRSNLGFLSDTRNPMTRRILLIG